MAFVQIIKILENFLFITFAKNLIIANAFEIILDVANLLFDVETSGQNLLFQYFGFLNFIKL